MSFDRKRILIGVTGTFNPTHSKNWIECESTWVPKLREKGYTVMVLLSDEEQVEDYKIRGNFFITKNSDSKDGLYHKRWHFMSDYILESDEFDYYFNIDSDSFVHPERFDSMMISLMSLKNIPDYLGCCIPYRGWNTTTKIFEKIEGYGYASGTAIFLSRKSMNILRNNFDPSIHKELHFDDKTVGEILRNEVSLFHDSRILFFSKYNVAGVNFFGPSTSTFIADIDSQLAIQHYCNGHMQDIMKKIYNT